MKLATNTRKRPQIPDGSPDQPVRRGTYRRYSTEQEIAFIQEVRANPNNQELREQFVVQYKAAITSIASAYVYRATSLSREDLVQEGVIALFDAL